MKVICTLCWTFSVTVDYLVCDCLWRKENSDLAAWSKIQESHLFWRQSWFTFIFFQEIKTSSYQGIQVATKEFRLSSIILSDPPGTRNTMATGMLSDWQPRPLWCLFHLAFEISASPFFYIWFSQILFFFTFCKTQSTWEILDDSRKETKLYFLVLFIFGNSFFGQSTYEFKWK